MKYYIHDNGGRPFMVNISKINKNVEVYKQNKNNNSYDKKVFGTHYKKLFLGNDPNNYSKQTNGNSILLKISDYFYVYIGSMIYMFKTKEDEILRYVSPVGNSDVPYPYAVSKTKTYLMLDYKILNNSDLDMKKDPYSQYYRYHNLDISLKQGFYNKNEEEKKAKQKERLIAKQLIDSSKIFRKKVLVKK